MSRKIADDDERNFLRYWRYLVNGDEEDINTNISVAIKIVLEAVKQN